MHIRGGKVDIYRQLSALPSCFRVKLYIASRSFACCGSSHQIIYHNCIFGYHIYISTSLFYLMPMSIIPTLIPPLGIQLHQGIYPHNRHTSLHRTLQLPHFTDARLQDPQLEHIRYSSLFQVQAVILIPATLRYLCGFFLVGWVWRCSALAARRGRTLGGCGLWCREVTSQ